jgi:hypothetical protein
VKINIFKIPAPNIGLLKRKIDELEMVNKITITINGWVCSFYLSSQPEIDDIPWVKDYETTIPDLSNIKNVIHYAIYLCVKGENCFALTYGKSHFYVRNFCDADFGLEMAKRIANENDVKQKASKRFSGKKKKEIKSFVKNTKLDSESGESVDYISAAIAKDKYRNFGEKSKFGASLIVSREDLTVSGIIDVLDAVLNTLAEQPRFDLPKTFEIKDVQLVAEYNAKLLEQIKNDVTGIETEDSSYDLIGTDFIFCTNEKYSFHFGRKKSNELSELSHSELKKFIETHNIQEQDILKIKIEIKNENNKTYSKALYEMIEYMVPNENVILEQGKWKKFNEEYIDQINASVDSVTIDPTEAQFLEISSTEPIFNDSPEISTAGYQKTDTDFSRIDIGTGYTVEAWDLQKENVVYAVKFGSPQKIVYVCSQAMNTLEIIRNNANLKKLHNSPKRYCLWMGFERSNIPQKLSEINSIILKQHVDMFARKCREIGIEPVLKFSKKTKTVAYAN